MHAFRDTRDRIWTIDITVDALKRVKALTGINLFEVLDDRAALLARLGKDLILLVDVLYALVKPEAEERKISDVDFGRAFAGDVLLSAHEALLDELTLFFPRPQARTALASLRKKGEAIRDRMVDQVLNALERLNPEEAAKELFALASGPNASAGSSPGSSHSPPVPTRSANCA